MRTCYDGFWRNLDTLLIIEWWAIRFGHKFWVKGHLGVHRGHYVKTPSPVLYNVGHNDTWVVVPLGSSGILVWRSSQVCHQGSFEVKLWIYMKLCKYSQWNFSRSFGGHQWSFESKIWIYSSICCSFTLAGNTRIWLVGYHALTGAICTVAHGTYRATIQDDSWQ